MTIAIVNEVIFPILFFSYNNLSCKVSNYIDNKKCTPLFVAFISKKVRKSDALAKLNIAKAISTLQIITIFATMFRFTCHN